MQTSYLNSNHLPSSPHTPTPQPPDQSWLNPNQTHPLSCHKTPQIQVPIQCNQLPGLVGNNSYLNSKGKSAILINSLKFSPSAEIKILNLAK